MKVRQHSVLCNSVPKHQWVFYCHSKGGGLIVSCEWVSWARVSCIVSCKVSWELCFSFRNLNYCIWFKVSCIVSCAVSCSILEWIVKWVPGVSCIIWGRSVVSWCDCKSWSTLRYDVICFVGFNNRISNLCCQLCVFCFVFYATCLIKLEIH